MSESLDRPGAGAVGLPEDGGGRPRIVVGVDGSPGSRAALRHALIAAGRRGADLDVVSSYKLELYYAGGAPLDVPNVAAIQKDYEGRAQALVTEVQDELASSSAAESRDVGITVSVSSAPAARALLDRSEGAALLVVGSRGRGAVRSALLGSVALHCVTHATCPVVVVHATGDVARTGSVVVGVDGSEGSRAALAAAVDEAVRMGADVDVVAAYVPTDYWTDLTAVVVPAEEEIRSDLDQRTRRLVEEVLAHRREQEGALPAVRTEVHVGSAADVLIDRARTADLLVVGSRGRGAFRGLLLGSIALRCAMRAPCPVMVVHLQASRPAGEARPEPAMAAGS
jgi:nucleotide-binding universal stress UspA family protein